MKISDKNKQKISEQILAHLYSINPRAVFTVQIARELVRDEEFVKQLLIALKKKDSEDKRELGDEIADVVFTLCCLANSKGINLDESWKRVMDKCYKRDNDRYEKK